ncbi:hypothetical protein PENTCL1PPCAC_18701 [Pristionchus entomophagus]|uniref:MADF domain-containing protein n=1 Tax=Pristionchus entomophagus TaxID=358040 RepID=A0AAV5TQ82_9BILA|nr:hypothetical protein PENTCL1PPCAC_18701 [Pristionchus entomophagus]
MSNRKTAHQVEEDEEGMADSIKERSAIPEDVMVLFIREMESNLCLWMKSDRQYKNVPRKEDVLRGMDKQFNFEYGLSSATMKWLKQAFSASISRSSLMSSSGCPSPRKKKEFRFTQGLMFLKESSCQKNKRVASKTEPYSEEIEIDSAFYSDCEPTKSILKKGHEEREPR